MTWAKAMLVGRPVALAVLWLLAGCDDGARPDADAHAAGWIEVGTGEWAFEPLEDGQDVPLVFGSQGGYHVWLSYRTGGLDPHNVQIEISTEILSRPGSRTASVLTRSLAQVDGPEVYGQIGWPAVITEAGCAEGQLVEVAVTLRDRHDQVLEDARTVVPHATVEPPDCP
jgi:hypothetical protein